MSGEVIFRPIVDETSKWSPVVGVFTNNFLQELEIDDVAKNRLLAESTQILANCCPPTTPTYAEAGLVVGYVQSGKTMSFTTVTALARDNGYGLVIVLAGVTNLLRSQSMERLVDDLGLQDYPREWRIFDNPGGKTVSRSSQEYSEFSRKVESWRRFQDNPERRKPSLLVTVLKQADRLNSLSNLLSLLELSDVPAVIIDDESDQASPNNKSARNLKYGTDDSSSIYASIDNLRTKLPKHTYLQYTATPQANLLAAKTDSLSPSFGRVLSAGEDYVGGEDFFGEDQSKLIIIPDDETINAKHLPEEPPVSLQKALQSFWIGAAIALAENHRAGKKPATRSMMIQVSAQVAPQAVFRAWAQNLASHWVKILREPSRASYEDLITEFQEAFQEISKTYDCSKTFDEVLDDLQEALEETKIVEVNSTDEAVKRVDWYESQFWILVGGMKLDRGFTVRGITTTYMPRTVSDTAATLQQRARFFGYHRSYFGLCRIFIASATREAFETYLEHERELRSSLREFQGLPLAMWKRHFILSRALRKPVQTAVIGRRTRSSTIQEGWIAPHFLHENIDLVKKNHGLTAAFVQLLERKPAESFANHPATWKDERKASTPHRLKTAVPTKDVLDFLTGFKLGNSDDVDLIQPMLVSLGRQVNRDAGAVMDVVLVNNLDTSRLQSRKIEGPGGLKNIFIGRNPDGAKTLEELTYVGDRAIYTERDTLHLRYVHVSEVTDSENNLIPVPWFALHATKALEAVILEEVD